MEMRAGCPGLSYGPGGDRALGGTYWVPDSQIQRAQLHPADWLANQFFIAEKMSHVSGDGKVS